MIFKSRHEIMADYYLNKTILDIKLNKYPEEINSIDLNNETENLKIKILSREITKLDSDNLIVDCASLIMTHSKLTKAIINIELENNYLIYKVKNVRIFKHEDCNTKFEKICLSERYIV
ncbi:hypothetical protein ACX03_13265 [Vibrio parahaemolyticus]|uniref:hypothetical protein n=2 Tax=Vibrio diabolicus TaxID=50719 RepID=UPI0006B277E5|nr:hypothetical protein [Vibrio diabolicus]KOY45084.1 hypothetical protein ACX03_13265 [Vibrio parahaemolyticus]MCQ9244252.1 hypothetical protein [Vibrio diabolicus]MCS0379117.1 hypothetical protein [Vibrio diabolicus]